MRLFSRLTTYLTAALLFGISTSAKAADPAPPPAAAKAQTSQPKALSPKTVLAQVNGTKITKADYDHALDSIQRNIDRMAGGSGRAAVPEGIKKDLLTQLIGREILYQESLKSPPKDLAAKVEEQVKAVKASYPKPEDFQARLKAEKISEKEFREVVTKESLILHYVQTEVAPKVKVTEAEAKKFYEENKAKMVEPEQVRASHILISVPKGAKPEEREKALTKAKALQKRAAKGEDFAKLATENSQDPGSAKAGGDLGFFTKDRMVEAFSKVSFALKPGQVSEVVESGFGFHVIKVTEKKAQQQKSFEETKDKIVPFLQNQAVAKAILARIEELKKKATIKVLVPNP